MVAYVIGLVELANLDHWQPEYRNAVTPLIEKHGGRYIARAIGSAPEMLEGEPPEDATTFNIIEFPNLDAARSWYADPEYERYKRLRQESGTKLKLILVDGSDG